MLSLYEIEIEKRNTDFVNYYYFFILNCCFKTEDEWIFFSGKRLFSEKNKTMKLNSIIFKKNQRNFIWTKSEDNLLKSLYR